MPRLDEARLLREMEDVCTSEGLPIEDAHTIWQDVQEIGLQNIVNRTMKEGKALRERWEVIADQPYSIKVADNWKPSNWEDVNVLALKKEQQQLGEYCTKQDIDTHTVERLHEVNLKLDAVERYTEALALNEYILEKISILKILKWLDDALVMERFRREVKAG